MILDPCPGSQPWWLPPTVSDRNMPSRRAVETSSNMKLTGDVRLGLFVAVLVTPLILIRQSAAAVELLPLVVVLIAAANRSFFRLRWHRRA